MKSINKLPTSTIILLLIFLASIGFAISKPFDFNTTKQPPSAKIEDSIEFYVINLDRSTDRLESTKKQFAPYKNIHIKRFSATDGYKTFLTDTKTNKTFRGEDLKTGKTKLEKYHAYNVYCDEQSYIKKLPDFKYNTPTKPERFLPFKISAGEIGISCSNRILWKQIAASPKDKISAIFEDDVSLYGNFGKTIERIVNTLPKQWDIIYIDTTNHRKFIKYPWTDILLKKSNRYLTQINRWQDAWGAYAYIINQESASKLLTLYNKDKNSYLPVDNFLTKMMRNKKIISYISKRKIATTGEIQSEIKQMGRGPGNRIK